jgi:hypothetical protein
LVVHLVVTPSPVVAGYEKCSARDLAAECPAIAGRRLMTGRSVGKPNPAPTRRRQMAGRDVKVCVAVAFVPVVIMVATVIMAMIVRPCSRPRQGQGPGEKRCCDGKFYVFHIDSFCVSFY